MYSKKYRIKDEHVDFQGVVDGLYYPFYFEWCRHSFMKDVAGLNLEEEFKKGHIHMLLEYSLKFKKSLKKDDTIEVSCTVQNAEKKNRVLFIQKISINDIVYAEAAFIATCLINGRPGIPQEVTDVIDKSMKGD